MKDESFQTVWRCEVPLVSKGQGEYREDVYPEDIEVCPARGIVIGLGLSLVVWLVVLAVWLCVG